MILIYTYFDAHCDTLLKMYENGWGIDNEKLMVNIKKISRYKKVTQVFALFNEGGLNKKKMLSALSYFKKECERFSGFISLCCSISQTDKKPLSAILAIEGLGNQPDFTLSDIETYYKEGVSIMGLSWNHDNLLCGGCHGKGRGISALGKQALAKMEGLNIILDVSHMSDKSFWESFENYSLPIVATHSDSRAIHNHPRNLTDEQFLAIKARDGVCGINLYPLFLCDGEADLKAIINHIEHFMSLGGENNVGLGSDFDGIDKTPKNIENISDLYKLFDKLLMLNYPQNIVDKILYKNFYKLFKKFNH